MQVAGHDPPVKGYIRDPAVRLEEAEGDIARNSPGPHLLHLLSRHIAAAYDPGMVHAADPQEGDISVLPLVDDLPYPAVGQDDLSLLLVGAAGLRMKEAAGGPERPGQIRGIGIAEDRYLRARAPDDGNDGDIRQMYPGHIGGHLRDGLAPAHPDPVARLNVGDQVAGRRHADIAVVVFRDIGDHGHGPDPVSVPDGLLDLRRPGQGGADPYADDARLPGPLEEAGDPGPGDPQPVRDLLLRHII